MQIVKVLLLCVHVFHTSVLIDGVKLTGNERTFSSAAKGGEILGGIETTLFETGENEGPGYVSQQWYTHLPAHSRVRMYIDGETQASLDFDMYLFHGIGDCVEAETRQTPLWGTKRFGHLASGGGLYNNIRIPFSKSIKVTIEAPSPTNYWYIIRIVFGLPLSINDYELPAGSRLRLYKTEQRLLEPFEFLDAANSEGKAGWVYLVTLDTKSSSYLYLEACFRYTVDGQKEQFLSSGTEDMFLSAFYFNRGLYHTDSAGLTCFDGVGHMSAYKFFETDPLFFKHSMKLQWRCGEKQGSLNGCPNVYQHPSANNLENMRSNLRGDLNSTLTSLYVWVYEYDL